MLIDRKTQQCQNITSSQFDSGIQHNLNQNLSKLFCELAVSKVYMKRQQQQQQKTEQPTQYKMRRTNLEARNYLICTSPALLCLSLSPCIYSGITKRMDKWSRMDSLKTDPHKYSQPIFDKEEKRRRYMITLYFLLKISIKLRWL